MREWAFWAAYLLSELSKMSLLEGHALILKVERWRHRVIMTLL